MQQKENMPIMKFIRQLLKNKKQLILCERSVFQLLEQFVKGEKGPKAYSETAKAHANLLENFFLLMYLEDLVFCIKRVGWKVTKIHLHLTFEQARFKRKFILMNQKSRQESKNSVEKDFCKLVNNSNFGYDCRNNVVNNCKFVPIFDEYKEINRYLDLFIFNRLLLTDIITFLTKGFQNLLRLIY